MSEVCENHGRIRCGECAYIEELKERLSEKEVEIERLKDNLYKAIEALKTVIYHPRSHAHVRAIADNALTYTKEGETNATQTSSRS